MHRRDFLFQTAVATAIGATTAACRRGQRHHASTNAEWHHVRDQFHLVPGVIEMSALFISSHPKPVRDAIERYRGTLDNIVATPTPYADSHARLSPSIRNSSPEVDIVLREIRDLT